MIIERTMADFGNEINFKPGAQGFEVESNVNSVELLTNPSVPEGEGGISLGKIILVTAIVATAFYIIYKVVEINAKVEDKDV